MADQQVEERKGREGGRWINERPSSTEVAEWFTTSMKLDAALNHEDYIGGVVLIPALDSKAKVVTGFHDGKPVVDDRPELSYIPYAKVETRIHYFWDLLAAHPEWLGIVEPVELPRIPIDQVTVVEHGGTGTEENQRSSWSKREHIKPGALSAMVHQLPPGFSIMSVPVGDGYSHFLCSTIRVAIYNREEYKELGAKAVPLRTGRGTKQVPMLGSYQQRVWAENSSLMKAETGALGRALGFAGIFVIPGSGVATAEDMIEAMAQGDTPTSSAAEPEAAGPAAPTEAPARTGAERADDDETELRARAGLLYKSLSEHPEKQQEFGTWARSRKLTNLTDAKGALLRGVVKRLERLIEEAAAEAAEEAPSSTDRGEEPDPPTALPTPTDEQAEAPDGESSGSSS